MIDIDLRTLIQLLGGAPAALWKDWVRTVIAKGPRTIVSRGLQLSQLSELEAMDDSDVQAAIDRRRQAAIAKRQGAVAVVPVRGVIIPRPNFYEVVGWATSVQTIVGMTRAAVQDPDVKAVVMAFDSPGGSAFGVQEGFDELMALRGDTPIVAVSEHLMASAAYWLASAADEIVAAPSALTGSVGAFMLHVDYSKALEDAGIAPTFVFAGDHKVEGNPYEPLTEEAQSYFQSMIDDVYKQFTGDIVRGRDVQASAVRGEAFGLGRVLTSAQAKSAGMIDQVRTLRETLMAYGIEFQGSGSRARALAPQRRRRALALMERNYQT